MFIFKKVVSQFFYPMPLCIGISILGLVLIWFSKKRQRTGKVFVTIGIGVLTLLSFSDISRIPVQSLEKKYTSYIGDKENLGAQVKYVVVLGGGHMSDPSLSITSQLNGSSLFRVIEGIRIYRKIPGSKLLLSGGTVSDPNAVADMMKKMALELGVPNEDILIENKSRDTKDQAVMVKEVIKNSSFIMVTSASHMPRAMAMFEKVGLHPVSAPAGYLAKKSSLNFYSFFPNSYGMYLFERAAKEYMGIAWAKIRKQI